MNSAATPAEPAISVPLFPLRTVLFPGGRLPLRVFEQRYVAMTKACVRDGSPFGVCLITRGSEVALRDGERQPDPEIASIGTLARIERWDMVELGIFQIEASGTERFAIEHRETLRDGLVVAQCTPLPPAAPLELPEVFLPLASFLGRIADHLGPERFPADRRMSDATWVGYRLAEVLPLPLPAKQMMLEMDDGLARLAILDRMLREQGLG